MALSLLAPQAATPLRKGLQVVPKLLQVLMLQRQAPRRKLLAPQALQPPPLAKAVA
jgi:hypothetical protein